METMIGTRTLRPYILNNIILCSPSALKTLFPNCSPYLQQIIYHFSLKNFSFNICRRNS
ncbi:unnamed protein product [Moneuplotes crassus]|uniref:Uncharacterized protein n=1 Tax=Euplotes crassus TaxID=5936 RepID=A0AAD2D6U1_EUPCR|nr:unnamed protein product [Moneuplotes crassus]